MCTPALSSYNYIPREMQAYLRNYGYSFSKRACEYAVKQMMRKNTATGKLESIEPYSKEKAEELLSKHGIKLERNIGYNFVYVINMIYSDRWKSSIEDELHLCKAVKDEIDDEDAVPESIFRCWMTKQEDKGIPIPWEDMI
jgi:hypothetical protein|nr:MAG TPA: hypothetical protein [Caudoviricetes sp.]